MHGFVAGFGDFLSFLCGINGSSLIVLNYTGHSCGLSTMTGADLNLPSITIAVLNQTRTIQRTVTSIAANETYSVRWSPLFGVSVTVTPASFFIVKGQRQILTVVFKATINSSVTSFGKIGLYGSSGHVSNIPLSVILKISSNGTKS
eukprot:TRINITY_DN3696_c0_g1_i11.p1 TRINITY_DN3696_c0_g1~~TRINITY_DN3696_c0_g1_i11.p1  ORF type:complete len:147 (-),score=22.17 TRINITY_DN3696_c0_g1_i11:189-629(-)